MAYDITESDQAYADAIVGRRAEGLEAIVIKEAGRRFDSDKRVRFTMGIRIAATAQRLADQRRLYCKLEIQDCWRMPTWPAALKQR